MKKKILMFVFNRIHNDVRVLKTYTSLTNAGYVVDLYGISDCYEEKSSFEGVNFTLIPCYSSTFYSVGSNSAVRRNIIISNVKHYLWNKLKLNPKLQPDIIYTHDMSGIAIGGFLKEMYQHQGHSIKWVHDLHEYVRGLGINSESEDVEFYLEQEVKFIHKADQLITVSRPLAELLKKDHSLPELPLVILNTPVVKELASSQGKTIRESLKLSVDVPLAVYSGGISPARGIECLIDAVALHPSVHLVLVSNNKSEYMSGLIERVKKAGISNRFYIHPYVPPNEIPYFLSSATLGIHPIREYGNSVIALPNKLFDYLHARIPVIVSSVKTMAEFVDTYKVGRVFKVDDPQSLSDEISKLLSDISAYKARLNSVENLLKEYSWETQEVKLINMMSSL